METIAIIPSESKLWEQTWRLYTESFHEHDRRRISSHRRAVEDARFRTKVAVENGNLLGLLFYWTMDEKSLYVEHLAVNPSLRGRNIGTSILNALKAQNPQACIVLETEPPADGISERRARFYIRNGFVLNDYQFTHPSYRKNGIEHELAIFSYPNLLSEARFASFRAFVRDTALKYTD